MEVSGQLHASADLPTGKDPPVPTVYEAWWTSVPVWTLWTLLRLPGIEPRFLDRSICNLVSILTE
jgi:hypothetical protein